MAQYKVPQDVEADDKLIGPFTFRQFIYLIIVAMAIALAWVLSRLFFGLALIPLPIVVLFGALALPLRKDQPMETYLAAMVSFFLKPHKRLWDPDGTEELIEISAPMNEEVRLTKEISQEEADKRFGYLAKIVDTQGWAVRGVDTPNQTVSSLKDDEFFAAQQFEDIMDERNATAASFDVKLNQSESARKQAAINIASGRTTMHPAPTISYSQPRPIPTISTMPQTPVANSQPTSQPTIQPATPAQNQVRYEPYPEEMRQKIIQPLSKEYQEKPVAKPSNEPISADIINLANNANLNIDAIAREANRIHKKQDLNKEVYVSLR